MSGNIAFSRIAANNLVPLFFVEFNNKNAGVNFSTQASLLIGQSSVTNPALPIFIPSPAFAYQAFGQNAMLARMCAVYFAQDNAGPLYALPLADATGAVKAAGSVTVAGAATQSGAIALYVAGNYIPVGVNAGDSAATIAQNLYAAIQNTLGLPVTAVIAGDVINITALHGGTQGNNIDLRLNYLGPQAGQITPNGVTITIVAMTGGSVDPDLGSVAAALGDQPFDFIGHPYADSAQLAEVTALMNDATGRWAWNRQVYGHSFTMAPGQLAALLTLGSAINDQHQTIIGVNGSPSPPWDWVADWMGAVAVSARNLPSQPLQTLAMQTVLAPPASLWWNYTSKQQLLSNGIAVPDCTSYAKPVIDRCVTTYQKNSFGVQDESYLDAETLFTLMAITRQLKAAITQKYARSILVPNGTRVGSSVPAVTPNIARAKLAAQYSTMEANGLVTSAAAMIAGTVVQINTTNPSRLDILWTPYLANGLRMVGVSNQFSLNPFAA